ncbi:MAG: PorV/PorQ family protein [Candidatus Poribacteria bacterium]|nr:PorV/PorQ family protein [Candidatus Poribacteria bacterium]
MKHKSKFKSVLKFIKCAKVIQNPFPRFGALAHFRDPCKFFVVSIITLCAAVQPIDARYTADFLTLGVGARALGMGGAGTALSDNAYAPYWNPAGLGQLTRYEVSFMHSTLNKADAYDFVGYVHPLKKRGAIGVSWLRVGVDDIPITSLPVVSRPVGPTNRPEVIGSFNNTDNAFLFASGWKLPSRYGIDFHLGGTLKLLYMSGYRSTNAIGGGADIGFIGMTNPEKPHQLMLGLQVSDVFTTKLYWNTPPPSADLTSHTETILPHLKIGIATVHTLPIFRSTLILALDTYVQNRISLEIEPDVEKSEGSPVELHAGAEWTLFDLLSLRIGFSERSGSLESVRQLTAGVGLNLRFVTGAGAGLDYAFANHPALGGSHRISLRIRF